MDRKLYDLVPADDMLFYAQKFSLFHQLNNIATSCFFLRKMDEDLFRKAVTEAVRRNDSFSMRIVKNKETKKIQQYYGDPDTPELGSLDFRGKTQEEMEAQFLKLAKPNYTKLGDKPMYKLYVTYSPDGYLGLYSLVSHMILDSWSIIVFYNDVYAVYHALETGAELPKGPKPYEPLLQKELEYADSEKYKKDEEFWRNEWKKDQEPLFSWPAGSDFLKKQREKSKKPEIRSAQTFEMLAYAKHLVRLLPADLVSAMGEYCKKERVSMQSLYLLGVTSYLGMVNDHQEDITVHTVNARRGTLTEKNSGGNRVHFSPYHRVIPNSTSFQQAAMLCYERQAAILRHIDYPPMSILAMWTQVYGTSNIRTYAPMSVTFQPVPMILPDGTHTRTSWHSNGVASNPLYITVMDDDCSGALRCYYEYQTRHFNDEQMDRMHRGIENLLREGIADPNKTMEEIFCKVEKSL